MVEEEGEVEEEQEEEKAEEEGDDTACLRLSWLRCMVGFSDKSDFVWIIVLSC